MPAALSPRGGEGNPLPYEFEPSEYLDAVRRFLHEHGAGAVRNPATLETRAYAQTEEDLSRAFVAEQCPALEGGSIAPEETEWISEEFSTVMGRLVKVSAKAAHDNPGMVPFGDMGQEAQDEVRQHVFDEYMELSAMFVKEGTPPSKSTYQTSPVLYRGPEEVRELVAENGDLGSYNVIRAVRHHPLGTEDFLESAREEVERAVRKFPAISRATICTNVLYTPANYEKRLLRYAKGKGIRLEAGEPVSLEPESFLGTLRELVRSRQYDLSRLKPPAELSETAAKLGREALATVDKSGTALDARLREIFRKRVELLAIVANRAWSKGDLDVTLERSSEESRRSLYARVLADLITIHAEVNGHAEAGRLTLFYDPADVQKVTAANPDLPGYVIVHMMLRYPDTTEVAIDSFRTRLSQARKDHPRMDETDVTRMALWNSNAAPDTEAQAAGERRTSQELIGDIRSYLKIHPDAVNAATKRSKAELEERLPEIEGFFEAAGWTFAGIELPPEARPALVKKIQEFITANERAYRDRGMVTRLSDFSVEERSALYGEFAEDYAQMVSLLGIDLAAVRAKAPVLYISAGELADLRARHGWMKDSEFRAVVVKNPNSIEAGLEKVSEVRALLKLTYPGLKESYANIIAVKSPVGASKLAIRQIRKASEWEFARSIDLVVEPTGEDTRRLYKHLRTLAKHNLIAKPGVFDPETEEQITEFRNKAAELIAKQPGSADIDDEQIDKILNQIEYYLRVSEALHQKHAYPSVLNLDVKRRNFFVKYVYSNQVELNRLTASQANGSWKFRTHSFGFFHDARYLSRLWERYEAYMPQRYITFIALMSPRRPMDALNDMVEYRAGLVRDNPDLSADEINKAIWIKASRK